MFYFFRLRFEVSPHISLTLDGDDIKPDDIKPDDIKPDDIKPDDIKPDDIKPDDIKPDDLYINDKIKFWIDTFPDITLKKKKQYFITGGCFDTEEEARKKGETVRDLLYIYSLKQRIGINCGNIIPDHGKITDEGKKIVRKKLGIVVENDSLGLTVYKNRPPDAYLKPKSDYDFPHPVEPLKNLFNESYDNPPPITSKVKLALELYFASFFETTQNAQFLSLIIAIETLLEFENRDSATKELVDVLINTTNSSSIPKNEKKSIEGTLKWLYKSSISQAGKKLAKGLLNGKNYTFGEKQLAGEKFFVEMYGLRSKLVHGNKKDDQENDTYIKINKNLGQLREFVADLISASIKLQ